MFKSAFISIIGLPNAGKSTLLNAILGETLVIANKKAQTTRHRIKGILNSENYQFVFSDTPGIIEETAYTLQDQMMLAVKESLEDADILLFVIDASAHTDPAVLTKYRDPDLPVIVALNKIDLSEQDKVSAQLESLKESFHTDFVFAISALNQFNVESLLECIIELSPEHPPYFEQDIISDENMRFHVAEIIRDQMLTQFDKEIPYSAEILVENYIEEDKIDKIFATIYLERDSQKAIVLGKGGAAIKKLGTNARKRVETFIQKKVYLALSVKIRKNWRSDELQLKRFGYIK